MNRSTTGHANFYQDDPQNTTQCSFYFHTTVLSICIHSMDFGYDLNDSKFAKNNQFVLIIIRFTQTGCIWTVNRCIFTLVYYRRCILQMVEIGAFFYSYLIVHEIHRYQSLVVTQSIKVSRVVSLKYSCLLWLWYVLKWNLTFHLLTLIWSTAFHHSGHTKAWYW